MSVQKGFSLVELMIVVAIIGILAAVAVPNYAEYTLRGMIPEATSELAKRRIRMEQYYQDRGTYVGAPACTDASPTANFTFSCTAENANAYTLQAAGAGPMANFTFTVDQSDAKTSTTSQSGWSGSTTCWITRKSGACS
jgi:type IV pilus assembly protein PilE